MLVHAAERQVSVKVNFMNNPVVLSAAKLVSDLQI